MVSRKKSNSKRYAIAVSRFNEELTQELVRGALQTFKRHGVAQRSVDVVWVAGAFELPVAALSLARSKKYRAVVALGCILEGKTPQYHFLAQATYKGLVMAGVLTGVPVTSGVIVAKKLAQARERASIKKLNRGGEAAEAAMQLATTLERTPIG